MCISSVYLRRTQETYPYSKNVGRIAKRAREGYEFNLMSLRVHFHVTYGAFVLSACYSGTSYTGYEWNHVSNYVFIYLFSV